MGSIIIILVAGIQASLGQPILQVTFDGDGCPSFPATKVDNTGQQEIAMFENFQVSHTTQKESCQVFIELALADRCLDAVVIENSLYNSLPLNSRGLLTTRTYIDGIEFQAPISIAVVGQTEPFHKTESSITTPIKKYCGERITLRLDSTLETLDEIPAGSLMLMHQKVNVNSPQNRPKERGPIQLPITFSGSGCSSGFDTVVTPQDWKLLIGYHYFNVQGNWGRDCEVRIPLKLFDGCLLNAMVSTSISNNRQVYENVRFRVNGRTINWQSQRASSPTPYESTIQFQGPYPAICGDHVLLSLYTTLNTNNNNNSYGGAITSQIFQVNSIGSPQFYSGQDKEKPSLFILLLPVAIAIINQ